MLMKAAATTPLPPGQQTGAAPGATASASPASAAAAAFASSTAAGLRCEKCGFTQADFKKHGRFGCPHCYEAFASTLAPMLDAMHKGASHTGKVPRHAAARKTYHDRISQLELALADAIKTERYEDAARHRDEITQAKQACGQ
jgi:protein arginine kinase activator